MGSVGRDKEKMRIAQVAPLMEAVPPKLYGGTERIVWWLTEELVRQGHDVTLFATADSRTSAKLIPAAPRALRLAGIQDQTANLLVMLDQVRRRADEFDVIHFHVDLLQLPMFQDLSHKCLTTLHGRLDLPGLHVAFEAFSMPLVSISDHQREPVPPCANWLATIYHGLPGDDLRPGKGEGGYLAFLGRICPEKRADRAIEIAKRAGVPLKIAAKIDDADKEYHSSIIQPLLDHPLIEFVGEIGDAEKTVFLGNALALVFPIDWPEPFGLVMIEAIANGTPVIAWPRGAAPEVIEDGVTGFLVDDVDEAVRAVARVRSLDRAAVRRRFKKRFTVERMTKDYVRAYEQLASGTARPELAGPAVVELQS
jgi:glycosyltransferase involved in cell wall biosynthesis